MASPQELQNANTRAMMLKEEGDFGGARDYLHHSLHAARRALGALPALNLGTTFALLS